MVSLSGHKVYLDASTVIYALEGVPQYANLHAGLLIPLDNSLFTAVTSEITPGRNHRLSPKNRGQECRTRIAALFDIFGKTDR